MALVLAPEPPIKDWLAALDAQIARSPAFFDGRPVVVDLAVLPRDSQDVEVLMSALTMRNIRIIGTEGAHPSWPGIEKWGLSLSAVGTRPARPIELPEEPVPAPALPAEQSSLLIDHPIRSGQSIVFDKGDVTVIGSVGWGAEIMAGGSIHVYGTLRGRAIAGLTGNPRARIFCSKLEAELVAIDGMYRTAEDMEPKLRGRSIQAWLQNDTLMMAALD
jgi:septum site-determining protein MinC